MKRDIDLICEILKMLEALGPHRGFSFDEAEAETFKRPLDVVTYNVDQADQMGLIEVGSRPLNGPLIIMGLTQIGHDFLEVCSNSEQIHVASVKSPATSDSAITVKSEKTQSELLSLKLSFMGMSVDLKELFRRIKGWLEWQK
jgi:hypothetical protein